MHTRVRLVDLQEQLNVVVGLGRDMMRGRRIMICSLSRPRTRKEHSVEVAGD
jgi:hypothetical protein